MSDAKTEAYLAAWKAAEEAAETMGPIIGGLYRDHGIVIIVYGISLVGQTPIQVIKTHRKARRLEKDIGVSDSLKIVQSIARRGLAPTRIDVGHFSHEFSQLGKDADLEKFLDGQFAKIGPGGKPLREEPKDIVLYGFGRIGRLLARILIEKTGGGDKFRLRAIVVRKGAPGDLKKRASLLRYDSVHGSFKGTIEIDEEENALVINGNLVRVIYSAAPEETDYAKYGIKDAVVLDNTGIWRDREGMGRHLKSGGVSHVILTAPGKGDIPNIVFGVNHNTVDSDERLLSAASCTTNAIVPVLKVISDKFGIENGHMETCHSYTNDQNLIDNYHPKERRGRGAPLNMVLTETGAAKAVSKAIPELAGKLTGNAIRVPTPNVSLAVLNLNLENETDKETVNAFLRATALDSALQAQVDYTQSTEVVSSDFVGNSHAGIVDSYATITHGKRCVLYVWYDNEYGYSAQVVRLLQHISKVAPPNFPAID
ncbi:MAG: glyceraldehyde-3-phosphate dehydrogenase [Polyangiaceae bacterium]|nr:glyceraldehyde-3-phosphate dehydrogenase [Polyangiaceae bacterium]